MSVLKIRNHLAARRLHLQTAHNSSWIRFRLSVSYLNLSAFWKDVLTVVGLWFFFCRPPSVVKYELCCTRRVVSICAVTWYGLLAVLCMIRTERRIVSASDKCVSWTKNIYLEYFCTVRTSPDQTICELSLFL